MSYKPKMRIQLLDKDGITLSDRLVDQTIELMATPKDNHTGPVRMEFNFTTQDDIDSLNNYLNQLRGHLPIKPRKVYVKSGTDNSSDEPVKDLLDEVLKGAENQEHLINILREKGFVFVTTQFLYDKNIHTGINSKFINHQWMVRRIKTAVDPRNDKYDPQLLIGIRFLGEKRNFIQIYLYGEHHLSHKLPWPEKLSKHLKKITFTKFPDYMNLDEREKWRLEKAKLDKNPELKATKFFNRWAPDIQELNINSK